MANPTRSVSVVLDVHRLSVEEVAQVLGTNIDSGLEEHEVLSRLETFGPNAPGRPPVNWARKIAEYLLGGFSWLLWLAAAIAFVAWRPLGDPNPPPANLALALVLLVVLVVQIAFAVWQDWTSSRIMAKIEKMLPTTAMVRRDGAWRRIDLADLVPGDVVQLKYGNKVPADVRIVAARGLKIDNSVLTGESTPLTMSVPHTSEAMEESRNIARMSSFVAQGEGVGVVFATGDRTLMGAVAQLANGTGHTPTHMQREIARLVRLLAIFAFGTAVVCMIVWAVWLRVDYPNFVSISAMLSNVVGIIVGFLPDGLPIAVMLVLLIVAQRMRRLRVLVRSLHIVETLGCVDLICSDKTGTLTTNCMTVVQVVVGDRKVATHELLGPQDPLVGSSAAIRLVASLRVCNSASYEMNDVHLPAGQRAIIGDATDTALLRFAHSGWAADTRRHSSRSTSSRSTPTGLNVLTHVPFSSSTKWMATFLHSTEGSPFAEEGMLLIVKGAPDVLLRHCTHYCLPDTQGTVAPLDDAHAAKLGELLEVCASQGQRVILVAYRHIPPTAVNDVPSAEPVAVQPLLQGLCLLGLVALADPPRADVPEVIRTCRTAGIRVFMVTGDYEGTAAAIARTVGIFTAKETHSLEDMRQAAAILAGGGGDASTAPHTDMPLDVESGLELAPLQDTASLLLTGSQVNMLSQADWDTVARYREVVFARTTPEQKLQIVREMQARGSIAAVTGDGVNDTPALKQADIGVAMGSGADMAMQSAAMVLLDSRFASLIVAIREGRRVFDNLKKVCLYLLPAGSFSELTPVFVNLFLGVPAPLSGFWMIIICVITDIGPALSLMFEEGESDLLRRRPRRPSRDSLVNTQLVAHAYLFVGLLESVFAHLLYFTYMRREWGVTTSQLMFAFDRWGVEGYAGLTAAEQLTANATGQAVFFIALVVMQFGNLMATRTRTRSILQQPPWSNPALFVGTAISLIFALGAVYGPAMQQILGMTNVPGIYWVIPIPLAFLITILDELRKLIVRRRPQSLLARFAW